MAITTLTNAYFAIGSTDLSGYVRSITLEYNAEEVDATCMGDGARTTIPGFLDWSCTVEFAQDYADNMLDEVLFGLVGASAASTLHIRPDAGAISTSNPEYTGDARLFTHSAISGGVGDLATTSATFKGNGTLTRDVTP